MGGRLGFLSQHRFREISIGIVLSVKLDFYRDHPVNNHERNRTVDASNTLSIIHTPKTPITMISDAQTNDKTRQTDKAAHLLRSPNSSSTSFS